VEIYAGFAARASYPRTVFAELLAQPGVVETCELRSPFGVMAFHGGSLERGTDVIAAQAAERANASLYAVALPEDLHWHVPSRLIGPSASPPLAKFLDHVETAVALHGYGRDGWWTTILVGGRDRVLAGHVGRHLRDRLPAYDVVTDLALVPPELRGLHPDNPVNRCDGGGVQIELPPRVRGLGPRGDERTVDALVDAIAIAATTWAAR
jgi:phage replication-related protein YjqB (UPF0714/DUF867 family)